MMDDYSFHQLANTESFDTFKSLNIVLPEGNTKLITIKNNISSVNFLITFLKCVSMIFPITF